MLIKRAFLFSALFLFGACANINATGPGNDADTPAGNGNSSSQHSGYNGFENDPDHPEYECNVNIDCGESGFFCQEHHCYPEDILTIKQTSLPVAKAENYYSQKLEVFNGTAPYEWLVTGVLPEGITYDFLGNIKGTPSIDAIGSYPIRITVFDTNNQQASTMMTLEVVEPDIYVATTELPTGSLETDYLAQLETAYGTEPFQWRMAEGSLPPGLTLNSNGSITGIPQEAGTFTFSVKVFDNGDPIASATRQLSIYVEPQPLSIKAGIYTFDIGQLVKQLDGYSVTVLLPMMGPYSANLGAIGGVPPYTWAPEENLLVNLALSVLGINLGLPEGLTMNASGAISGTTTAEPTAITIPNTEIALKGYLFMATVTDSENSKATGIFLIPVIDLSNIWDLLKGLGNLPNLPF